MTDYIQRNYELVKVAKEYAEELVKEHGGDFEAAIEAAHDYVGSSEHVVYTARAISICSNCHTDEGESWLEEIYEKPFDGCESFADVCTHLACAVLYCAVLAEIETLKEESEDE